MHEAITWHTELIAKQVVESLNKNHFSAEFVSTKEAAVQAILNLIPENAVIGMGGSWTLQQIGITPLLEARGNKILNHNKPGLTPQEVLSFRHGQLSCDVFLSGTNAITLDGQLVNTDGIGNRVAAMIFGPKKTIIVAGTNKIVRDLDEAQSRIDLIAAPINCKRLNRKTPCVQTGQCMDCQSPERICNITTVLHKRPTLADFHIILVGEELGF